MPLCVLLWILVSIPFMIVAWIFWCKIDDVDPDLAANVIIMLALVLLLATPNLLWFRSVRDVMFPASQPTLEQPVEK